MMHGETYNMEGERPREPLFVEGACVVHGLSEGLFMDGLCAIHDPGSRGRSPSKKGVKTGKLPIWSNRLLLLFVQQRIGHRLGKQPGTLCVGMYCIREQIRFSTQWRVRIDNLNPGFLGDFLDQGDDLILDDLVTNAPLTREGRGR